MRLTDDQHPSPYEDVFEGIDKALEIKRRARANSAEFATIKYDRERPFVKFAANFIALTRALNPGLNDVLSIRQSSLVKIDVKDGSIYSAFAETHIPIDFRGEEAIPNGERFIGYAVKTYLGMPLASRDYDGLPHEQRTKIKHVGYDLGRQNVYGIELIEDRYDFCFGGDTSTLDTCTDVKAAAELLYERMDAVHEAISVMQRALVDSAMNPRGDDVIVPNIFVMPVNHSA